MPDYYLIPRPFPSPVFDCSLPPPSLLPPSPPPSLLPPSPHFSPQLLEFLSQSDEAMADDVLVFVREAILTAIIL